MENRLQEIPFFLNDKIKFDIVKSGLYIIRRNPKSNSKRREKIRIKKRKEEKR